MLPASARTITTVRRRDGFTTVELMVVVAIVGIVSVPALIFFASFLRSQQLDGAAQQVIGLLNQARQLAITHNTSYRVEIDVPNNRVRFVRTSSATPWVGAGTDGQGYRQLENRARFTAVTASPLFNGLGTASPGTITVQAVQGGDAINVVVNTTGRVRRCVPAPGCP